MSTLQEIETAVGNLSRNQQEELLAFLLEQIGRDAPDGLVDPFEAVIGAFAGPVDATGRKAEEILYGKGA